MKKINITQILVLAGLILLNACDPTKDFKNQYSLYVNSADSTNFVNYTKVKIADTVTVIALTSSDYARSSVSNIKSNKNFSDAYPAKTYLPEVMNNAYIAKTGNQVKVNYNYYNPLILVDSVSYTIADGSYGNKYNNYSKLSDVYSYLTANYPDATRGKTVILTYKWFANSTTTTVTNTFVYLGSSWIIVYKLTSADYTTMGQSYADFSTTSDAQFYIPTFIKNNASYAYAKTGDNVMVQYALYVSGKPLAQTILQLTYSGSSWATVNSVVSATQLVYFTGSAWKCPPSFTITTEAATRSYTLTDADYTLVGNGQYKDFDTRSTGPEGNINVLLGKLQLILITRFPEIFTGSAVIFAVTYNNYTGTIAPATLNIKVTPQ